MPSALGSCCTSQPLTILLYNDENYIDHGGVIGIPDMTEPSAAADTWHVPRTALNSSTGIDLLESPLLYTIQFLANEDAARHTKSERPEGSVGILAHPKELRANVVWRFLHDRGYINPVSLGTAKSSHPKRRKVAVGAAELHGADLWARHL